MNCNKRIELAKKVFAYYYSHEEIETWKAFESIHAIVEGTKLVHEEFKKVVE